MSFRNQLRRGLLALPLLGLLIVAPFAPDRPAPPRWDPNADAVRLLPKLCLNPLPIRADLAG